MGCLELEEKLIDYSEGLLEGADQRLLESHLAECTGCQKELRLLKLSWSCLDAWAPIEPSPILRARVWEEIRLNPQPVRSLSPTGWFGWGWKALRGASLGMASLACGLFCCFHLSLLQMTPHSGVSGVAVHTADADGSSKVAATESEFLRGAVQVTGDALAGSEKEDAGMALDLDLGNVEVLAETNENHDEVHLPLGRFSHELLEDTHDALSESMEDS